MSKTVEWGRNRFQPMVIFAHTVAMNVEACHEIIIRSRQGLIQPESQGGQFSRAAWLECYRRASSVEAVLLQCLEAPERIEECDYVKQEWPGLRRTLRAELRNLPRDERNRKLSERYLNLVYRAHLRDVEKRLQGHEDEVPDNAGAWFDKPELVFFLSVAAPCLLKNGCWPAELMGQAWRGDFEALEKLLRLDPIVATERHVADQLFRLQSMNPDRHRLLLQAKADGRTKTITLPDLKFSLAGLLSKWSHEFEGILRGELLFDLMPRYALRGRLAEVERWIKRERKRRQRERHGCSLTAPAIRKLFDAIAYDTGRGLIDRDLPQEEEAFRKRVHRNMSAWPSLRNWDKIRAA